MRFPRNESSRCGSGARREEPSLGPPSLAWPLSRFASLLIQRLRAWLRDTSQKLRRPRSSMWRDSPPPTTLLIVPTFVALMLALGRLKLGWLKAFEIAAVNVNLKRSVNLRVLATETFCIS